MREIKFRAWDKSAKVMLENITPYNNKDGEVTNIGMPEQTAIEKYGDVPYYIEFGEGWMWLTDNFEVMQYTGLKDINGFEVYEGDILHVVEVDNEVLNEWNTQVTFEDGCFLVKTECADYYDTYLYAILTGVEDKSYPLFETKVVGNIYKNPELLESEE